MQKNKPIPPLRELEVRICIRRYASAKIIGILVVQRKTCHHRAGEFAGEALKVGNGEVEGRK